jgi:hypothetical protein
VGSSPKKQQKLELKRAKKAAKNELKAGANRTAERRPSAAVRYAESVRGVLYVVLGASLVVALILGERGALMSLDDIVNSLFAARAGKVVLALIALGFLIYGLKHLRVVR